MTSHGGAADLRRTRWDADELIVRIKALVQARNDLRRNGGSAREIQERSLEIGILQTLLAREVRRHVADDQEPPLMPAATRRRRSRSA